jgi:hypothetical protein
MLISALIMIWFLSAPGLAQESPPGGATISTAVERRSHIKVDVFDPSSGRQLYTGGELIVELPDGTVNKQTWYSASSSQQIIQKEEISFHMSDLRVKQYRFENSESGELVESNVAEGDKLVIKHRADQNAKLTEKSWAWMSDAVVGKTLVHFMEKRWQDLNKDQKLKVHLLVPSKADAFVFRMERVKNARSGQEGATVIKMEPDSWLVRQFVPLMEFWFRGQPPVIEEFTGPSPVDSGAWKGKLLRVKFTWTPVPEKFPPH